MGSGQRNLVSLFRIASSTINGVLTAPLTQFDGHGRSLLVRSPLPGQEPIDIWIYNPSDGWLSSHFNNATQVVVRDPSGHVIRLYDVLGDDPTQASTGRETLYTYRPDGLVSTMTSHDVIKTFAYDDAGGTKNETGWTDSLGRSMAFARDARGNITTTFDGLATTHSGYDLKNRLIETRDALGNATTYGYAHAGCSCSQDNLVTSIHTPDLPAGVDWTMAYDHDARLSSVTDPHGFTESYEYETTGELKKTIDKLLRPTTWSHDQLGRVANMLDTLGRSHAHTYAVETVGLFAGPTLMAGSANATLTSTSLMGAMRNGDYQIGQNAYPGAGYPAQISLYQDATLQLAYTERFDHYERLVRREDRVGLPFASTGLTNPDGIFRDEQNAYAIGTPLPLLTSMSSAVTPTTFQSTFLTRDRWFDISRHDAYVDPPGDILNIAFTRDAGGRPASQTWSWRGLVSSRSSTYTYRPDGRLARLVNPDGSHDFTYNSRGLMETQTVLGEGTYTFGHDAMGRNDFLQYPDSHVRRQSYDDLGRLTSRCYEYPPAAPRCYTADYDAVGNPVRMTDPDGEDVLEYDALDRLTKVTRQVGGATVAVEDYAYNALGALSLNAGVALDHQRPRLDGVGLADAAVPATLGGEPIALDAGGSITSLRGVTFKWSRKGFLEEIQAPAPAAPIQFGVDAELRRTAQRQGSVDEINYFEGLDRIAVLDAATSAVKESYLFDGIDHPLRIKQGTTTAYCELDLAGNVRGLRASGGGDLGKYRFTAFGRTAEDTTTIVQPLRWKGRWHSLVGGAEIYDVRARQWAPELAAFLTIDEYVFHDAKTTLWGWPSQNPVQYADPFGHGPFDLFSCIWATRNFSGCWQDEKERAGKACSQNPKGCELLGGTPGRGGPFSNDESVIRRACREEGDIAYQECLRQNHESFLPSWACRGARATGERKCLEKAGLSMLPREGFGGVPCAPGIPIPAVP